MNSLAKCECCGENVQETYTVKNNDETLWLCKTCYDEKRLQELEER